MITHLQKKYKENLLSNNNEIYNANRVFDTYRSLIKEFYNEDFNNKKILDLGEGDGSFIKVLETKNLEGSGLDLENVDFEKDSFPIESESIDIITSNSVIEHLRDVSNFFNESYRVLKKNGIIILVTPNFKYNYQNFYDDSTHVNPFTAVKLKEILELFNFKDNKVLPWLVKKSPKIFYMVLLMENTTVVKFQHF